MSALPTDQLEAATQTQGATVTAQQAFRLDRIGNITSKQDGSEISKGTFNNRNQLTAQQPGGWMRVRGTTNEGASVKVKSNANPFTNAATTSADGFSAWVQAAPGANTVTVEAKDDSPNANTRTQSWSVNITGQSRVPSYDLNGNMTANGLGQTYLWDAENRLVKITYADNSKTEFTYDGLSRRVRITERNASNTITGDKRYLWAGGNQPAEEREANGTTVTKRYFPQGEQRIGGADAGFYYYTKDHLGSVREITNSSGALVTRYDFDLWGKRTKLTGSMETEVGFTGHHHHAKSGLVLTWFRAYDAEAGRWLSADPLGESGGMNLYGYGPSNPLNGIDPTGGIWHHLVPFTGGLDAGLSPQFINSASNGFILSKKHHNALHKAGWLKEWNAFFKSGNVSCGAASKKLNSMMNDPKYKNILKNGTQAVDDYPTANANSRLRKYYRSRMKQSGAARALAGISVFGILGASSARAEFMDYAENYIVNGDPRDQMTAMAVLGEAAGAASAGMVESALEEARQDYMKCP